MSPKPYEPAPGGLRVFVRLQPRARREGIEGVVEEADGRTLLKVAVGAPPEDGKANAALIALLGKSWRLPKSAIEIVGGATSRRKVLLLSGDPASLEAAIAPHLE
ncbi:MAG: DUF167 domain-containing protein [Rhodospirillaceae bacterium]|nr:DUF167 domain-containing protein [Rhodospirillaceae bacterium]